MSAPEQFDIVGQWLIKDENDLRNAGHTLTMEEACPLDTVCFHAQQCAEKYLKALLAFDQIDFPKSHDLAELVMLFSDKEWFPLSVDECERLTDYATVTRYPGDWEGIVNLSQIWLIEGVERTA
jgi:HEPN domain-containing protein